MKDTNIEWADHTWNPTRGCSLALMPGPEGKPVLREGCRNCYAKALAARFSGPGLAYEGFAMWQGGAPHWTGRVEVVESKVEDPLKWKEPARIFVDSMSDIFHEKLQDLEIIEIIAVMAMAHWHTFQVLTKRPDRMQRLLSDWQFWEAVMAAVTFLQADWNGRHRPSQQLAIAGFEVPLKNVWWGASIEDRASAAYVIPFLLKTPSYVRWLSCEPLLEDVGLSDYLWGPDEPCSDCPKDADCGCGFMTRAELGLPTIDWAVIGLESGKDARPGDPAWIRTGVKDCIAAKLPVFVKQLGAVVVSNGITGPSEHWPTGTQKTDNGTGKWHFHLKDKKGGDMAEWPEDLRVRQYPARGM